LSPPPNFHGDNERTIERRRTSLGTALDGDLISTTHMVWSRFYSSMVELSIVACNMAQLLEPNCDVTLRYADMRDGE
jgi:hypothetical protein